MTSDSDESYDPHARMHESFPRVDSGSTQMAGDVVDMPQTTAQQLSGNIAQSVNERSMTDIANRGPKAVDPRNLILFPGKNPRRKTDG